MNTIRLIIVDDHPVIEQGLKLFLQHYPEIALIGAATDAAEGLILLKKTDADVILLDLAMPGLDGIAAIHLYLQEKPDVHIVIFSGHRDDVIIHKALESGARGYVLKGSSMPQIVEAIKTVHSGGSWLCSEANASILKTLQKKPLRGTNDVATYRTLTEREEQVFRLLARGRTTEEIADILRISPKTVAKHRVAVKQKLRVNNVAEVANFATRIGLNTLDAQKG